MQEIHLRHVEMHAVNWRAFDLNLLVVFDGVMQERNVTRAGKRLGISQPALSHALNRLRYLVKDPLFVRTPTGMLPTPRAQQLAVPIRHALAEMQRALEPDTFVPATAARRFAIAVNNYTAIVVAAPLVAAVAAAAPSVRLDLRPSGTLDIPDRLDRGDLDLAIGSMAHPGERFHTELLLEDPFVAVMRRGHPAGRGKLSADTWSRLPHLAISSSDEDPGAIERSLGSRDAKRRIVLRAPYLAAGAILARSDMIATVSRRIAEHFVRANGLQMCELSFKASNVRTVMLWHRSVDNHAAHRWLRDLAGTVARTM
jgi:DNA-binding transcriptional LysR family regulator